MKLNTYLNFNGCCEAAFRFYAQHLGADISTLMTFGDGPAEVAEQVPVDWRDKIMHAHLTIGGHALMGTDGMGPGGGGCAASQSPTGGIQGAHVVLYADGPDEAERIHAVLSQGGRVEMPLQETFFACRFGMAVDPFGVPWMVLCE